MQNLDFLFNLLHRINKAKVFLNFFQKNIVKRKIREAIKEDKEEKDSLHEIKFKSQAAMEYLMTYGWAILIIALTLAVLYSLGIMNPKNFLPRSPPGSCFVFRPNGPGTTDFVSLQGTCGYLPMYVGSFNGVNGYISVPDSASLDITSAITLELWFNMRAYPPPTSGYDWYDFLTKSDYTSTYGLMYSRSGIFRFYLNPMSSLDFTFTPSLNTWYHIVCTWNGSIAKIFLNGIEKVSGARSGTLNVNNLPLRIGMTSYPAYPFNGSIANVQIYNTALTPQEIQYLYQQGLGGGPVRLQNLVAWWPLNGDAKDYSGNNNHGTIYGGVTFVQNYNPP